YIDGQRARYVSPMALFLFGVFLMFAAFQLAGISAPDDLGPPVEIGGEATGEAAAKAELEALREARNEVEDANPAAAVIDSQIETLENRTAGGGYRGMTITRTKTGIALIDKLADKWRA